MKNVKGIIAVIGLVLFAAGMFLIFQGTEIGMRLAQRAMNANGGQMGTQQYHFIMESNTLSCQLGGAVLSIIGGICAVVFGYKCVE